MPCFQAKVKPRVGLYDLQDLTKAQGPISESFREKAFKALKSFQESGFSHNSREPKVEKDLSQNDLYLWHLSKEADYKLMHKTPTMILKEFTSFD